MYTAEQRKQIAAAMTAKMADDDKTPINDILKSVLSELKINVTPKQ